MRSETSHDGHCNWDWSCCDLQTHRQGSVAALKGSISGDSFDLPLPDVLLHPLERLAPSGPWVFPHPDVWRDKARGMHSPCAACIYRVAPVMHCNRLHSLLRPVTVKAVCCASSLCDGCCACRTILLSVEVRSCRLVGWALPTARVCKTFFSSHTHRSGPHGHMCVITVPFMSSRCHQIPPFAMQVLVRTTGGATYTAQQLPKLLDDLGLHQQAAVYPTVRKLNALDKADFQARSPS